MPAGTINWYRLLGHLWNCFLTAGFEHNVSSKVHCIKPWYTRENEAATQSQLNKLKTGFKASSSFIVKKKYNASSTALCWMQLTGLLRQSTVWSWFLWFLVTTTLYAVLTSYVSLENRPTHSVQRNILMTIFWSQFLLTKQNLEFNSPWALTVTKVNRGDWLRSPASIKGTNKDAKTYVGSSTTLHNVLFCAHTLWMRYVTNAFLLVSSSIRTKQPLCFVQGQDQTNRTKTYNKEFLLLTILLQWD